MFFISNIVFYIVNIHDTYTFFAKALSVQSFIYQSFICISVTLSVLNDRASYIHIMNLVTVLPY